MSFQRFYSFFESKPSELDIWSLHFASASELLGFSGLLEQQFVVRRGQRKKESVFGVLIFKGLAGFYRNMSKYLLLK